MILTGVPSANAQSVPSICHSSFGADAAKRRHDDRGRFFLEGLAPGTYILQANMRERGAATARVSVAGSEMMRHDLTLVPTGTLQLKAVDEEGKPVQGIYFQFMDDDGNWVGGAGMTDQNGVARSEAMRAGPATLTIYEEQSRYTAEPMRVEILSSRSVDVEVKLKKKEGGAGGGG